MKISIITPVYNDPRIRHCLESVVKQEGEFEIEHIVVDSESRDDTVDVLRRYNDHIDHLIRENDNGMYDALNKGIKQATGDVVGILNADDRYQDRSVLADVASSMEDRVVNLCYGDLVYVDGDDDVVRYWKSGSYSRAKFYYGWMPPHPTLFIRRELYEKYGLFDTSFSISSDYELMLRFMFKNKISADYIDRVLVRMELGGMSNSSVGNMVRVIQDMYGAWQKYDSKGRFVAPFLHPIEKVPQFCRTPPAESRETGIEKSDPDFQAI